MKIKSLTICNIGKIKHTEIVFNKSLNLFYGEILSGKTTILNAVKLCFGGGFSQDLIRHGAEFGSVQIKFNDGYIKREFYKAKDETIKAKPIQFVNDGVIEKNPVNNIKQFLNPFLLNQDHLINMTEYERKKYFAELFGVNITEDETRLIELEQESRELRAKIKGYGEIEIVKIEKVDAEALVGKRAIIICEFNTEESRIKAENEIAKEHNYNIRRGKEKLLELKSEMEKIEKWLKENKTKLEEKLPEKPDVSEIEKQISQAYAENVKYEQYLKDKQRSDEKEKDVKLLQNNEDILRNLRKEKIAKLAEISKNCKIKGLSFDEKGNFIFENTFAGMLSTSQLMRLSSELSKLYPEGFGIELIDRGESLGKSIFEFVDRAKVEEKTILATIVGEKPADIPENIGVFVVDNGIINGG